MPERSIQALERRVLQELTRLVAQRAEGEHSLEQRWSTGVARATREFERIRAAAQETLAARTHQFLAEHRASASALQARYDTLIGPAQKRMERHVSTYNGRSQAMGERAKREHQEALWLAETIVESGESKIRQNLEAIRKAVETRTAALSHIEQRATDLLDEYRLPPLPDVQAGTTESPETRDGCLRSLEEVKDRAIAAYQRLERIISPPALRTTPMFFIVVAAGIGGAAAGFFLLRLTPESVAGMGPLTALVAFGLLWSLRKLLRRAAPGRAKALAEELRAGRTLAAACLRLAEAHRAHETVELQAKRAEEIRDAERRLDSVRREVARRTSVGLGRLREAHSGRLRTLRERWAAQQRALDDRRDADLAAAQADHDRAIREAEHARDQTVQHLRELDRQERTIFVNAWKDGMARVHEGARELQRFAARFPDWKSLRSAYAAPEDLPAGVAIGRMHVDMASLPGGLPTQDEFRLDGPSAFELPVAIDFTERGSLLVKAPAAQRSRALDLLNAAMLRILTSLPPGKARFTIIDPVGLGESFAGFMHLADHEESLVSSKIWTEPRHIEQRLTDLTEHMETVIQKYLRNEYESIRDYNRDAGEIAEPLRFLILADFPANLTEAAAKRLASILTSGPRCGVYTLIAGEFRGKMPPWLPVSELERASITLSWNDGRWTLQDDDLGPWPLDMDQAPGESLLTELVHTVGRAAKDVSRVQVPFEAVAPQNGRLWSLSAAEEIRVPLGRSGAKKLQYMVLGRGTAQHALVAGRTGSGKSTLFHVLITSLGLWYSPEEVELYLVDFKKGVEFKTYATHNLPHARVIAVESEREFGLSVLRRLDAELTRRGALFRDLGVQDMAAFRRETKKGTDEAAGTREPGPPRSAAPPSLPRILFLVDEFQEFFVEDDKIAQEAALLLDRLVRQGRAFGMHVVLGSQTLGGAYSIARSTLGQMAVRIALQCSEADSYLIMSEDNAAPRLLSRPGEAIYNDASGLVEGNSPFQVVWLPDERRDVFLGRIEEGVSKASLRIPPPVVFEGNVPADMTRNQPLARALAGHVPQTPTVWLGDAVSIKDPTSLAFKRQSGSNLLIIGQHEDAVPPMLLGIALSLRGGGESAPRLVVLDALGDDPRGAAFVRAAHELGARAGGLRETGAIMAELADELTRREAGAAAPPIFLIIDALHRFRDLRRGDDYAFSMEDKPASPAQLLARLLRDGPSHGIHTIAWIDTVNNLERTLERNLLREFEARILFQMSGTDSTHLIESPAASTLGRHRALLYREDLGQIEKFRPYAMPREDWTRAQIERLSAPGAPPLPA
jgi:DNA segregation ATPase FtsK/SpoIIIE, S-DNA-T family